jgi:hypothetical protein
VKHDNLTSEVSSGSGFRFQIFQSLSVCLSCGDGASTANFQCSEGLGPGFKDDRDGACKMGTLGDAQLKLNIRST